MRSPSGAAPSLLFTYIGPRPWRILWLFDADIDEVVDQHR